MVDFRKRAAKAADSILQAGEAVLAGVNVTPSPFSMRSTATGTGAMYGGLVGAAIGAAVDKRREGKDAEDAASGESDGSLPALAQRAPYEVAIPKNGALLAVTSNRLLAWSISGLGKPGDLLVDIPLAEVDSIEWHHIEKKLTRGTPKSLAMWFGIGGDRVLPASAISQAPAGKYVTAVIGALTERLPGKVAEFTK